MSETRRPLAGRRREERETQLSNEPLIAVFIDFENLALGVRDMNGGKFRIELILKRLLEKGRIVFKRAYCDWTQYRKELREFHGHGIELVDIPQTKASGKNSADIHMVVDALDLCYSKSHIDTFALLSGDSDFSPLAAKLKENDKRVIGCGVKNSTSDLLIENCDEFICYDDLVRVSEKPRKSKKRVAKMSAKRQEAFDRVLEVVESLTLDHDTVWGSMVKQAIRRIYPQFSESFYGYSSFSALLQDLQKEGLVGIKHDEERGNDVITSRPDAS